MSTVIRAKQIPLYPENGKGEWDFTSEPTQYLTHGLHPYLASMIPQIPDKLLTMYADDKTRVLDPFVGGGAVLVETYLRGLEGVGLDVNPLAIILSKAKTTYIPEATLVDALRKFLNVHAHAKPVTKFDNASKVDFWFKSKTIRQLIQIKSAIDVVVDDTATLYRAKLKTLLDCIFSNTVRDVSLTYRGEVRLRKLQDKDLERFNPNAVVEFEKRWKESIARVSSLPKHNTRPEIVSQDCRTIPYDDNHFNLVITSPPYGDMKNTIPYHQFSKNMLYWLGFGDTDLKQMSDSALGAKDGDKKTPKSVTLSDAISHMKKPNLIHEAVCFYADYFDALKEIARVTKDRIVIVIGHRILDGTVIDNPAITTELMANIGWRLEDRFNRGIRKKRLNRAMGFGNNAQGATIDSEAILIYSR